MQQQTYNNTTAIQRKRKAVEFASGVFKRVVLGETLDTEITDTDRPTPSLDALVGTKLPDGRLAFAKIVRIEKNHVLLMPLKVRDSDAMAIFEYVADIGSLFRRSIQRELVWPVDGTYNRDTGFYEIFTSLDELGRTLG